MGTSLLSIAYVILYVNSRVDALWNGWVENHIDYQKKSVILSKYNDS